LLAPATLHEDQLTRQYKEAVCDDHFKFYMGTSYRNYNLEIQRNDWNVIQRVSIDKGGKLIGFMSASIDRESRVVGSFGILNFTKKTNIIWSMDIVKFIRELRDQYDASKFEFVGFVGSDAERMYRRFIEKHGGNIAGTLRRTALLIDGNYYDSTLFEIMREDMNF
jgi:hypothetical protein